jgi:hypothetical protein
MFKFIGAVFVGLLTMGATAYFVTRSKKQRSSDFIAAKNLATQVVAGIKNYLTELLNPKQSTGEMA